MKRDQLKNCAISCKDAYCNGVVYFNLLLLLLFLFVILFIINLIVAIVVIVMIVSSFFVQHTFPW